MTTGLRRGRRRSVGVLFWGDTNKINLEVLSAHSTCWRVWRPPAALTAACVEKTTWRARYLVIECLVRLPASLLDTGYYAVVPVSVSCSHDGLAFVIDGLFQMLLSFLLPEPMGGVLHESP